MKIHINRDGKPLGQFAPEEVRARFESGEFLGTDLAWRDGMDAWRKLSDCVDELAPAADAERPAIAAPDQGLPWEQRGESGFFTALLETVRLVLLEPTAAFTAMKPSGGYGAPLFFAVVLGSVGALANLSYNLVLGGEPGLLGMKGASGVATFGASVGTAIVLIPVFTAASVFVGAALYHFFLIIVGGAHKPYEATFRVTSYCSGATAVLQLLPGCGSLLALGWFVVCLSIGLAVVHGISRSRASVAVLLASILVVVSCVALFVGAALVTLTPAEIEELKRVMQKA